MMDKKLIDSKMVYNHEGILESIKAYTDLGYWVEVEIELYETITGTIKPAYRLNIYKLEED